MRPDLHGLDGLPSRLPTPRPQYSSADAAAVVRAIAANVVHAIVTETTPWLSLCTAAPGNGWAAWSGEV
jgi:hypothetical protein